MTGEDTVAIVKQVFVSLPEPDGLAQLLQRPGRTRMGGDVAMDQTPAAVLDNYQHVEQPEGGGDDDQEVTGNDSLGMQA